MTRQRLAITIIVITNLNTREAEGSQVPHAIVTINLDININITITIITIISTIITTISIVICTFRQPLAFFYIYFVTCGHFGSWWLKTYLSTACMPS